MTIAYPVGSEWRKWDLQVHSPYSALNNGFGDDFDAYAKNLFALAVEREIAVIGVTDYFSIAGYRKLRGLQREQGKLESLLGDTAASRARLVRLLPNVELRSNIILQKEGKDSRLNLHVILSDDIREEAIEEFLCALKFTAEASPGGRDERWALNEVNLAEVGAKLKAQHDRFRNYSDLFVGMMNAIIDHESVTEALEAQPSRFRGRFLLVTPIDEDLSKMSWDGQGHLFRKLVIQKSHMIFSSNANTRAFGLGRKHESLARFLEEFKSLKPCVHGSDAHTYATLFTPADGRQLWIKADPTFNGLQQLLHEPESRVHIGDEPEFLVHVRENGTKYLRALSFERTPEAAENQKWFAGEILLNPGLVAIIGKKGSGKSAIADVVALLGNSRIPSEFAFLNAERFLEPKAALGKMFRATLKWHAGPSVSKLLGDPVDPRQPERVKYVPQKYLENICTELASEKKGVFDAELAEVIFSHVTAAERQGKSSLSELIEYLTAAKQQQIAELERELHELNVDVAKVEDHSTSEYRTTLLGALADLIAQRDAHEAARPPEVVAPAFDEETPTSLELAGVTKEIGDIESAIAKAEEALSLATRQASAAERILTRIQTLRAQVSRFHSDSYDDAGVVGIDINEVVSVEFNETLITDARVRADAAKLMLGQSLDEFEPTSLPLRREQLVARASTLRDKLNEPDRRYGEYCEQLKGWEARRAEINGTAEDATSIAGYERRIAELEALPAKLVMLRSERTKIVARIFQLKEELLAAYRRLYAPVQKFIDEHPVGKQQGALRFYAKMAADGFSQGLLSLIHQGRKGPFYGEKEGRARADELANGADFSSAAGVQAFVDAIEALLRPTGDNADARVSDQLKQAFAPVDLYDFLFGLTYLNPRFELRWYEKPISHLSAGERGSLLLIFYLLIDKRDVPLVIDQPEENLDNQTIATLLVPAIKTAKRFRQIIMVTHNPNLAVVCDADQIVHTAMDKADGHRVSFTTGALENERITALIVDVLEGTKPAFDLRDARYEILERARIAELA